MTTGNEPWYSINFDSDIQLHFPRLMMTLINPFATHGVTGMLRFLRLQKSYRHFCVLFVPARITLTFE